MKYSQWIGIGATFVLIYACFLPWTWYPDLQKSFTGFFSEMNIYGRPGMVFIFLSVFIVIFFLVPRVWAKRGNVFFAALLVAYAIKSFILFSGCYMGTCPEKKPGLWIMLFASVVILLMTIFPDQKLKNNDTVSEKQQK